CRPILKGGSAGLPQLKQSRAFITILHDPSESLQQIRQLRRVHGFDQVEVNADLLRAALICQSTDNVVAFSCSSSTTSTRSIACYPFVGWRGSNVRIVTRGWQSHRV